MGGGEREFLVAGVFEIGAELHGPAVISEIRLLECLTAPVLDGGGGFEGVGEFFQVDGAEGAGHRAVGIEAGIEGGQGVELEDIGGVALAALVLHLLSDEEWFGDKNQLRVSRVVLSVA